MFRSQKTERLQVERLDDRLNGFQEELRALRDQILDLERPVRELQLEWEDSFEKFRNLYARISKRLEREQQQSTPPESSEQPVTDPRIYRPNVPEGQINPAALRLLNRSG